MSATRLRRLRIAAVLLCLIGFALSFALLAPGFLSSDSIEQLAQAKSGIFEDHHPIAMSLLWRLLLVTGTNSPMLAFQLVALWGSFCFLIWHAIERWRSARALYLVLLGAFPPLFGLMGTIWKDVQLGACFALAVAIAGWLREAGDPRGRKGFMAVALAAFLYAACVRHNSPSAWLPLLPIVGSLVMPGRRGSRRAARAIVGIAIAALLLPPTLDFVAGARKTHISQFLQLYDLGGIVAKGGEPAFPEWITKDPRYNVEALHRRYSRAYGSPLFDDYHHGGPLHLTQDPAELSALRESWLRAIVDQPGPWLRHKLDCFASFLFPTPDEPYLTYYLGIGPNSFGLVLPDSAALVLADNYLSWFSAGPLFKVGTWWIFSLLGGILAIMGLRRFPERRGHFIHCLCLFASAFAYIAGYFIFYAANDFRYAWWSVIATCFGFALLVPEIIATRRTATGVRQEIDGSANS